MKSAVGGWQLANVNWPMPLCFRFNAKTQRRRKGHEGPYEVGSWRLAVGKCEMADAFVFFALPWRLCVSVLTQRRKGHEGFH